ncbi:MAG: FAD-dependent thymidylate synthase [Selenomonadaceae bacterium]|nr:FAD-dependent thymidylate synthase [Selenomonadaceae bacterium]
MKIIEPSVELTEDFDAVAVMKKIERAGRVCYKSEANITDDSAEKFIRGIIKRGHESVIEHASVSFKIICDRGVTHELVRHRIGASFSQESTRFCDYSAGKFGGELTFIKPCFWSEDDENFQLWRATTELLEKNYLAMRANGAKPEEARSILPNSLKTEIFVTMNLRELRHFLKLRTDTKAHPQMRQVALKIFDILNEKLPAIFGDIQIKERLT